MVVIFALFLAWIYHEASERLVEYDEFAVCADSADPCCKSCDNKKNYTDSSYSVGSCASCRPTTGLTSSYSLQKCFDKRNANIADYTSATPSDQALRDIMSCGCVWKPVTDKNGKTDPRYGGLYPGIAWTDTKVCGGTTPVLTTAQAKSLVSAITYANNNNVDKSTLSKVTDCIVKQKGVTDGTSINTACPPLS
jgi:hypothetical protein